jgi:branched-chain amino acid transport system substrate-binding protein
MKRLSCRLFSLLAMLVLLVVSGVVPTPVWSQPQSPNNPNLLQEAETLYRAQRYEEALQRYEHYLRTSPPEQQWQQAWLRTAELYGIRGDWNQARARFERLLTMKTDSGIALKARYGVGQANYKLGNYLEAERNLENLSASNLSGELRFKTNALLTELSLQAGNTTQAFSRLLLVEKDLPHGEEEWFQDLKTRLLSRANSMDLEKLADLYRDASLTAGVLLQLVKLELQANRPEKAGTWLTTLQQRFPESPEASQAKQLAAAVSRSKPAAPPTIVGCLVPLSGEHAEFGRQVKNGLELAASQSGVALIIKDVGHSSQRAAAAVAELAANPQVLVLVGFFPTATADAAAAAAQRLEIPLLALSQKKDITLDRPYVFRDFLTQPLMLQALLNYTANTIGWQRYAILYPNSKYGQSLARQFGEEGDRHAARLVGQASYTEGGKDVAQAVQTLTQINHGPEGAPPLDAIFIPDEADMVAAIAKELAATPLLAHVHLLGTNLLHAPATLSFSNLLTGILFADGFFAGDADPAVKAFTADYRQQFQQAPTYLAAQGYSSMRLLAQAQKDSPELSREDFAQKLPHQTQPPGFSLFKEFNLDREATLTTKIITIQDKEFQLAH